MWILQENFRSTPRIIRVGEHMGGNHLAGLKTMETPDMLPGNKKRKDQHQSHMALIGFREREAEAAWIAEAIRVLVPSEAEGAIHDKKDGNTRGLALCRTSPFCCGPRPRCEIYMRALEAAGIPCVVRAGPDLFSQPEVCCFLVTVGDHRWVRRI